MDGKKGKTVKPYGFGFIDTSVARDGLSDTLNRVSYGANRGVRSCLLTFVRKQDLTPWFGPNSGI